MKAIRIFLLSAGLVCHSNCSYLEGFTQKAYTRGYQRAQSENLAREFQWRTQAALNSDPEVPLQKRYYTFQLPAHEVDGVKIEPHSRIVEIVE